MLPFVKLIACLSSPVAAFSNPYILSVLPPASHSSSAAQSHSATLMSSTIEIRLSSSLNTQQIVRMPTQAPSSSPAAATNAAQSGATLRLLSTVVRPNSQKLSANTGLACGEPVAAVYVSTPNDKLLLSTDGSAIWALRQETWRDQLDEMIKLGRFDDGLGLVRSLRRIPSALGKDDLVRVARRRRRTFLTRTLPQHEYERRLKTLSALSLFSTQSWTAAFNGFMALDITPAKVVALFPADQISGRLHIPQAEWVEAFGGPIGGRLTPALLKDEEGESAPKEKQERMEKGGVLGHMTHLGLKKKTSMDTLADKASIREGSIHTDIAGEDLGSSDSSIKEFAGRLTDYAPSLKLLLTTMFLFARSISASGCGESDDLPFRQATKAGRRHSCSRSPATIDRVTASPKDGHND